MIRSDLFVVIADTIRSENVYIINSVRLIASNITAIFEMSGLRIKFSKKCLHERWCKVLDTVVGRAWQVVESAN